MGVLLLAAAMITNLAGLTEFRGNEPRKDPFEMTSDEGGVHVVAAGKDERIALLIANPREDGVELVLPEVLSPERWLLTNEGHTAEQVADCRVLPPHAFAVVTGVHGKVNDNLKGR